MQNQANALSVAGASHVTWRYYNQIKKKAMDKEPGLAGLLLSLSIAFFIVIGGAAGLSTIYKICTRPEINAAAAEKKAESERWENAYQYLASLEQSFFRATITADFAQAAEPACKGQTEKYTHYLNAATGSGFDYSIKIKNTGKESWKKGEVFLETGLMLKRISSFKDTSWINYYRLSALDKDIAPGKTVEIKFTLHAPIKAGEYQEDLQLVKNGTTPINGTLTRVFITVTDPGANSSSSSSSSSASGTSISSASPAATTNTQNASLSHKSNKSKDFCIALNDVEKSQYEECNTSANETSQGSGIANYSNFLSAEPIIRVGLFNTKSAQRISSSVIFDIYSGQDLIYSGLDQKAAVSVSFDFNKLQYSLIVNGLEKTLVNLVRIVPRDKGGVVTLLDYEKRPAWNKSLNDNIFRNVIEFNYSKITKKWWVINELAIEDYLKGLAETSNISHIEFQKALITAARTYALYHYFRGVDYNVPGGSTKHAEEHFHVDAAYDQVYRGYGSEIRMPNLVKAVNDTRGSIVTYNSKIAITPYFSRSDGRTRSWVEVWGGKAMAWLVSVLVPEDKGQTLWGHGVGMSARGALLQANAGKLWQDILKYFYQGTDLKRLYN